MRQAVLANSIAKEIISSARLFVIEKTLVSPSSHTHFPVSLYGFKPVFNLRFDPISDCTSLFELFVP